MSPAPPSDERAPHAHHPDDRDDAGGGGGPSKTTSSSSSPPPSYWGLDLTVEDGTGWGTIGQNLLFHGPKIGKTVLPLRSVDGVHMSAPVRAAMQHAML